jgi:hypothetical protein
VKYYVPQYDWVTRGQMVRGGDFETIFSFTFDGMCRLFDTASRRGCTRISGASHWTFTSGWSTQTSS